jgi:hypothetical protein
MNRTEVARITQWFAESVELRADSNGIAGILAEWTWSKEIENVGAQLLERVSRRDCCQAARLWNSGFIFYRNLWNYGQKGVVLMEYSGTA